MLHKSHKWISDHKSSLSLQGVCELKTSLKDRKNSMIVLQLQNDFSLFSMLLGKWLLWHWQPPLAPQPPTSHSDKNWQHIRGTFCLEEHPPEKIQNLGHAILLVTRPRIASEFSSLLETRGRRGGSEPRGLFHETPHGKASQVCTTSVYFLQKS